MSDSKKATRSRAARRTKEHYDWPQLPCVVVADKTRYAIACKIDQRDRLLTVHCIDGVYDIERVDADRFKHDFAVCDPSSIAGKVAPTVAHFFDVINRSSSPISDDAANLLQELTTMAQNKTVFVTFEGAILSSLSPEQQEAGAIELTAADLSDLPKTAKQLEEALPQRARARFVTAALNLPKALERVKNGDKRIAQAVSAVLAPASDSAPAKPLPRLVQPSKSNRPAAPAKKNSTRQKTGVKVRLYELFLKKDFRASLAQLCKQLDATEVSVTTSIRDCRNPKYAPNEKPINIIKDEKGVYSVGRGAIVRK